MPSIITIVLTTIDMFLIVITMVIIADLLATDHLHLIILTLNPHTIT